MTRARFLGPEGFGVYEIDWSGPPFTRVEGQADLLITPGFVDLHIHGAFGIDFMSASENGMLDLCSKLEALGYEAFLPTTVTASAEAVNAALASLPDHRSIAGFHLEGPFVSRDYPGAQPQAFIQPPPLGSSEWDTILSHSALRLVTLAPEEPGALELVRRLRHRDVIASIGHTNATYDECQQAVLAGASHVTHTYNAMRPLHHREAGAVGFALTTNEVSTELIYDRLHVGREAADLLIRSKPEDKLVAVSDSTLATGLAEGVTIQMWGHECITGRKQVRLKANGALAGSAITLLDAFRNLHEDFGPETAMRACCLNPRVPLRLPTRSYNIFDRRLELQETRRVDGT